MQYLEAEQPQQPKQKLSVAEKKNIFMAVLQNPDVGICLSQHVTKSEKTSKQPAEANSLVTKLVREGVDPIVLSELGTAIMKDPKCLQYFDKELLNDVTRRGHLAKDIKDKAEKKKAREKDIGGKRSKGDYRDCIYMHCDKETLWKNNLCTAHQKFADRPDLLDKKKAVKKAVESQKMSSSTKKVSGTNNDSFVTNVGALHAENAQLKQELKVLQKQISQLLTQIEILTSQQTKQKPGRSKSRSKKAQDKKAQDKKTQQKPVEKEKPALGPFDNMEQNSSDEEEERAPKRKAAQKAPRSSFFPTKNMEVEVSSEELQVGENDLRAEELLGLDQQEEPPTILSAENDIDLLFGKRQNKKRSNK